MRREGVRTRCSNFLASLLEPSPCVFMLLFSSFVSSGSLAHSDPTHTSVSAVDVTVALAHSLPFICLFIHSTRRYHAPNPEVEAIGKIWPHMELPVGGEAH